MEQEGAFDENTSQNYPMLNMLNLNLMLGYHNIKKICSKNSDPKCCRDINYYLDLVTIFIKKSKLDEEEKKDLLKYVEDYWNDKLEKRGDYTCLRELNEDSIRKRCILKQLYDYCDDKGEIADKEEEYNTYLEKKWLKIIDYTTSTEDYLHFKIDGWNKNQLFNYKDFLLKPQDSCSPDYKNVNLSHITLSNEKPVHEILGERAEVSKNADEGRNRNRKEQQVPPLPSDEDPSPGEGSKLTTGLEGETTYHVAELGLEEREVKSGSPLWETPLSAGFSVAGSIFFFFFLYKVKKK